MNGIIPKPVEMMIAAFIFLFMLIILFFFISFCVSSAAKSDLNGWKHLGVSLY